MTAEPDGRAGGRPPVRMCARCNKITTEPVLVAEVYGDSGPGWSVYACSECAALYPKQPDPFALGDVLRRSFGSGEGDR